VSVDGVVVIGTPDDGFEPLFVVGEAPIAAVVIGDGDEVDATGTGATTEVADN
jgi:hypothetical protein